MQLSFEHRRGNARPTCVDMSSLSRLDPRRRPRYPAKQRILSCRHESCNAFINFPNMQTTRRIFLFRPPRDCSGARGEWLVARSPVFPDISCKAERRLRIGVLFRARAFKLIMDGRIPPPTHTHTLPPLLSLSVFVSRVSRFEPPRRLREEERARESAKGVEQREPPERGGEGGSVVYTTRVDGTVRINMEISQIKLVGEVSSSFSGRWRRATLFLNFLPPRFSGAFSSLFSLSFLFFSLYLPAALRELQPRRFGGQLTAGLYCTLPGDCVPFVPAWAN